MTWDTRYEQDKERYIIYSNTPGKLKADEELDAWIIDDRNEQYLAAW